MIKGLPVVLAETGKIKIGRKGKEKISSSGKRFQMPEKLDHFIVTTTERGEDGNFIIDKDIMGKLGPSPKEIPVFLPFDDLEANFVTSLKYYHGKTALCFGDNETAKRIKKDGSIEEVKCDFNTCPYFKQKKCKMTGTLSVIPAVAEVLGGVYKYRTTSWHSICKTLASLCFLQSITGGRLAGLRLKMKLLSGTAEIDGSE